MLGEKAEEDWYLDIHCGILTVPAIKKTLRAIIQEKPGALEIPKRDRSGLH